MLSIAFFFNRWSTTAVDCEFMSLEQSIDETTDVAPSNRPK